MAVRRVLSQLLQEWRDLRGRSPRDDQLRRDTAHLYLLQRRRRDPGGFDRRYPAAEVPLGDLPPFREQAEALQEGLLLDCMAALQAVRLSADTHPVLPLPLDQERREGFGQRLRQRLGFALRIGRSSIRHPEAGNGVFLEGRARAGSVVCLYPGVTYAPQDLRYMKNYPRIDKDNPYLLWRYDGIVLDGISYVDNIPWEFRNPLAAGHIINHVPPGSSANVLQFMYDYDLSLFEKNLHCLVPNIPFHPSFASSWNAKTGPGERTGGFVRSALGSLVDLAVQQRAASVSMLRGSGPNVIKGLVMVALRDLEDEELFFNYRFNAQGPEWYVDPDPEQSRRRWAPSTFWE